MAEWGVVIEQWDESPIVVGFNTKEEADEWSAIFSELVSDVEFPEWHNHIREPVRLAQPWREGLRIIKEITSLKRAEEADERWEPDPPEGR